MACLAPFGIFYFTMTTDNFIKSQYDLIIVKVIMIQNQYYILEGIGYMVLTVFHSKFTFFRWSVLLHRAILPGLPLYKNNETKMYPYLLEVVGV